MRPFRRLFRRPSPPAAPAGSGSGTPPVDPVATGAQMPAGPDGIARRAAIADPEPDDDAASRVSADPAPPVFADEVLATPTSAIAAGMPTGQQADEPTAGQQPVAAADDVPDRDVSPEPQSIADAGGVASDNVVTAAAAGEELPPAAGQDDLLAALAVTDEVATLPDAEPEAPNPLTAWAAAIATLFDERYYLSKYPDVRLGELSGLDHYLRHGWRKGADPAPWFSSDGYVQINKDVAASELPPFVHYVLYGRAEGRTIAPTPDVVAGRGAAQGPPAPTAIPDLLALRNRESMIGNADIAAYTEQRLARL